MYAYLIGCGHSDFLSEMMLLHSVLTTVFIACSKDEQKDNPFAAINALKFYEYSKQKTKQQLPYKHIHIANETTMEDESEEIDNILGK